VSRMSDEKALRFANGIRQYCNESPCKHGVCVFMSENGICPLKDTRLPADWNLDGLGLKREEKRDER